MGTTAPVISAANFLSRLEDPDTVVVDVRELDEFAEWHIPGAALIPLSQLRDRLGDVPLDKSLITVCAKGQRAAKAAEILVVAGHDVEILDGGMGAWGLVLESVATSFGDTEVVQFRRRGKGCLSYLLTAGSVAVVIDPVSDPTVYVEEASRRGATVRYVLDTHLHADHLSGARELAARSGATLLLNPADPFDYDYTPIEPGLRVELGGALHLTVGAVSTPGHTMGSTVYLLGDVALFTGDTLFLESVGRPDLADHAEEYAHALYRSLHQVVLELPDETAVFPAHYGESVPVHTGVLVTERLGVLRHRLAALALPEDEFVAWAVARVTDRPPNYKEIVKFNAGRSEMPLDQLRELELGPNRCAIAS